MKSNLLPYGHILKPTDGGAYDLISLNSKIPVGTVFPDGDLWVGVGGGDVEIEGRTKGEVARELIEVLERKRGKS
jgi:hypothetical protein